LPKKPIKHITKPKWPIGSVKDGKVKVKDGATGKESWRQGTKGFARDWDSDPTSVQYNKKGLKNQPKHHPKMGDRKGAYVGSDDE
jgi:hypothetical protein